MQISSKFQMLNFVAREGVAKSLNIILESLQSRAPSDSNCTALIVRANSVFHFEITLAGMNELFRSKCAVDTSEARCRSREWQSDVVKEMAEEIYSQIQEWHGRRFAA